MSLWEGIDSAPYILPFVKGYGGDWLVAFLTVAILSSEKNGYQEKDITNK